MLSLSQRDFYEVLGVPQTATDEEIKTAFRKAAMRWHPDRNPDNKETADERFKEVAEAFSVLGDTAKRAEYDRVGNTDHSRNEAQDATDDDLTSGQGESVRRSATTGLYILITIDATMLILDHFS